LATPVSQNERWKKFIKRNGIGFKPVGRNDYEIEDPIDIEIVHEARRMASSQVQRMLLVYDYDFIPLIEELQKLGKEPIVILPNSNWQGSSARQRDYNR